MIANYSQRSECRYNLDNKMSMNDYFTCPTDNPEICNFYNDMDDDPGLDQRMQEFSYDQPFNAGKNQSSSSGKSTASAAPSRPNKLIDDEAGLIMKIKRSDRPQRASISQVKHPENHPNSNVNPSPAVPSDCCHHQKEHGGRRKFVISFGANNANVGSECLISERNRCQDFWKFIDSHPNLLELIREGEFVHSSPPHLAITPSVQRARLSIKQNGEILRAKNKALHDAEKERSLKRKLYLEELKPKFHKPKLQRKSGQSVFVGKQNSNQPKKSSQKSKGCAGLKASFKEMMKDMNIYDKVCGNPVGSKETGGSTSSEIDHETLKSSIASTDEPQE